MKYYLNKLIFYVVPFSLYLSYLDIKIFESEFSHEEGKEKFYIFLVNRPHVHISIVYQSLKL